MRIIVQDASDRRSYERELLEARRQAELERTRAQVLARTLQRSLLPPSLSPSDGLEARAYFHAASADEVGGDFYDLFALTPPRSRVSFSAKLNGGKGANAAALTSLTRYTLRAAAVIDSDPVTVLHNLDAVFHQEVLSDALRFCTVIFGILTGRLEDGFDVHLASGGHPPPLLHHRRWQRALHRHWSAVRPSGSKPRTHGSSRRASGWRPATRWCSTRTA